MQKMIKIISSMCPICVNCRIESLLVFSHGYTDSAGITWEYCSYWSTFDCGCKDKYTRKVTCTFIDAYHGPLPDKKDIILAELDLMWDFWNILDEIDKKAHGIRESRIEVDHFVDQSNIVVKQIYNCGKKP